MKSSFTYRRGLTLVEMAIVILVIGLLMAISLSMVRNFLFLGDVENAAKKFSKRLVFVRNAAIKSNQIIYFEIDLDKESYRAYRLDQDNPEGQEQVLLTKTTLPESHSIHTVSSPTGNRMSEGKVVIPFLPSGLADGMAIYFGPKNETIEATVIYHRYSGKATIHTKEADFNLEDSTWEELDLSEQ